MDGETIGLYVHVPFCRVRCSYCAFAISIEQGLEGTFVDAVLREATLRLSPAHPIETLFFGGGTPSRLTPEELGSLIGRFAPLFTSEAEISLEANPEDVTPEIIGRWIDLGINRLSIGVQSFHDSELLPLGRSHGRLRAIEAVNAAVKSGIRTSVDLIIGLPDQTLGSVEESLEIALAAGVGHVSVYMLDLEPETVLERQVTHGRVLLPPDDAVREAYKLTVGRCATSGLDQYEVSNFARQGEECRHNLRYWERLPYVGLGSGAHSFDGAIRRANLRDVRQYTAAVDSGRDPIDFEEILTPSEEAHERLFLALRQTAGIRYSDLQKLAAGRIDEWIRRNGEEGLLEVRGERVAFTSEGFLVSNGLISELF